MIDDPAKRNGKDRNCGSKCTRHKLTVISDVAQHIWVGAHTYRYYSYADGEQCPSHSNDPLLAKLGKVNANADKRKNMLFNKKTKSATGWEAGDIWFPRMYVNAGEKFEVEIELNWDRPGVTKDWSVTAWGEEGTVTVLHNDGIPSANLPYQPKRGARTGKKYEKPTSYAPVAAKTP